MRTLNLIDEHTRECLMIRVERRWSSARIIGALAEVMVWKGFRSTYVQIMVRSSSRRIFANGSQTRAQRRCTSNLAPHTQSRKPDIQHKATRDIRRLATEKAISRVTGFCLQPHCAQEELERGTYRRIIVYNKN